jgi:hypothetical protein
MQGPPADAVFGISTVPGIGIGQRALLLRTPRGNVLWDCIVSLPKTPSVEWRLRPNQNMIAVDDRNCRSFRPHGVRLLQVATWRIATPRFGRRFLTSTFSRGG